MTRNTSPEGRTGSPAPVVVSQVVETAVDEIFIYDQQSLMATINITINKSDHAADILIMDHGEAVIYDHIHNQSCHHETFHHHNSQDVSFSIKRTLGARFYLNSMSF